MPDPNKLDALAGAGFRVLATCSSCMHFTQVNAPHQGWGRCQKITFKHAKHTATGMLAGVPVDGNCPEHVRWPHERDKLEQSGYDRFLGS